MDKRTKLKKALKNQLSRIEKYIAILNRWDKRLSLYRLIAFLLGAFAIYFTVTNADAWVTVVVTVLFIIGFIFLVAWHQRIERNRQKFVLWKEIRTTHLARMDLDWDHVPFKKQPDDLDDHPFATDLNIVGLHSLLQLLDTSIYEGGRNKLTGWLLNTDPKPEVVISRRELVEELKPMAYFRDNLQLKAAVTKSFESEKDWNMSQLLAWLGTSKKKSYVGAIALLGTLAAVNIILGVLFLAGILKPYVFFTFITYLVTYNFHTEKIKNLFDHTYRIEKLLSRFRSLLLYLETFAYKKNSRLEKFCSLYHRANTRPSFFLKKIIRIAAAASSQKNDILRLLLNLLMPWDLYFAHKLNRYKSELKEPLHKWLEKFYELEALCSLANFAWLNPDYIFSSPVSDKHRQPVFKAENLGHPLIPHHKKVTNDITIEKAGSLLLITGSNMSGKSTFVRTLGINLCLCFAGGPVNAQSFETIIYRLFTSINVIDSLDEGLSHFYAEVRRLRRLLEELERDDPRPLFFLVDEIFRGTNNRERLLGSEAFLRHAAGKNGLGVISTHDLELASLEKQIPQLSNWHFEETIKNGKMIFEYKLKPGPSPTTNALKIMKMEGLPVGIIEGLKD